MTNFREFERLIGNWQGTIRFLSDEDEWSEPDANLKGRKVLDGCAVMNLLEYRQGEKTINPSL